jgi:tripartite-type tricarboxylate transporter receptor subunit TctC
LAPDYFKGKTITFTAGSAPGGGTDIVSRLWARYLTKLIPGNPEIVVQNMEGGGGVRAANNICNVAKPDGLTWNTSQARAVLYAQVRGLQELQCDIRKLSWVGTATVESDFLILRKDSGITTLEQLKSATTPPKLGAQSSTDASYISGRVSEQILGVKFQHVLGYGGSSEVELDIDRGALAGRFGSAQQLKDKPEWLRDGIVSLLFTTRPERHPDYPDIPTLTELAPADKKSLLIALNGPATMSRTMVGPPGVPSEILAAVRDAFKRMNDDPAFQKEMDDLEFERSFTPGDVLEARHKEFFDNQQVVDLLRQVMSAS